MNPLTWKWYGQQNKEKQAISANHVFFCVVVQFTRAQMWQSNFCLRIRCSSSPRRMITELPRLILVSDCVRWVLLKCCVASLCVFACVVSYACVWVLLCRNSNIISRFLCNAMPNDEEYYCVLCSYEGNMKNRKDDNKRLVEPKTIHIRKQS